MQQSKVWKPKQGAPDYVEIRTADVWGQVKSKWERLGSPEAQCPVGQFGAAGSLENEECKRRVAPIWNRFEDVFPDLPETGPYNNLVDVVPVEEVCALGHFDDPEADIGDVPNLFSNPGGLAQKLQEWYLRSLVPTYCEIAPTSPMDGACFCWPYFWAFTFRAKLFGNADWDAPTQGSGVFFGPLRGFGVDLEPGTSFETSGYNIYAKGASNPGGFRFGTIHDCGIAVQKYSAGGGSGYVDAEILSVDSVTPFTPDDVSFYGLGYSATGPSPNGTCPLPNTAPPLPNYPNTRGVYMPLPVPIISFPVAPGCPNQEDNLNITFNLNVDAPPAGADGERGEDGKPGPTMIQLIEKVRDSSEQYDVAGGSGDKGGVYQLRKNTALVAVEFNVDGVTQENYREKRVFFAPVPDYAHRKEVGLGNVYLRLSSSNDATLPRMEISMSRMLIHVPNSFEFTPWELVVNDKADAGFKVIDLGYRHVLRKVANPDDIEEFEYYEPY